MTPVQCNLMLEPQEGMSWGQLLAFARAAEDAGLAGLYRSDHYASVSGAQAPASTDAWATLAGLALATSRITLGTMVSPVTFRPAGNLVKVVATVAEIAGSERVHLGLGTGWLEEEHRRFGFPFEDLPTRFARLEEHLAIVRGLWDAGGAAFSFDGRFERLRDCRLVPTPDPPPRVILGGRGLRRTPRLAARYADELNVVFMAAPEAAERHRALDDACRAIGREPAGFSLMTGAIVGRTPAEARDRAGALHARVGHGAFDQWFAALRPTWLVGTVDEVRAQLRELAEDAGVQRVMLQHLLPDDLEAVALFGELSG